MSRGPAHGAVLLTFTALLLSPLSAAAEAPSPGKVTIAVQVIRAAKTGNRVDPELTALAKQLSKQFPEYRSYSLLETADLRLAFGEAGTVTVPDSKPLTVTPKARRKDQIVVGLKLTEPDFATEVRLTPGTQFLVGGPKLSGGVLILAVTARLPKP